MHNAYHVPAALGDQAAGDVMLITNEDNSTNCAIAGQFLIASLKGTRDATDNVGTPQAPVTMERLAAYSTLGKPGEFIDPATTPGRPPRHRRLLGALVHGQGQHRRARQLRAGHALPRRLRPAQPAAGRLLPRPGAAARRGTPGEVVSSNTAGAYWHGSYVYVADYRAASTS